MRHLYIVLSLLLFNISGCATIESFWSKDEAVYETPVRDPDAPLTIEVDPSMASWYESLASIDFVAVVPARSDIEVGEIYINWDYKDEQSAEGRLQRMIKRQRWKDSIVPESIAAQRSELDLVDMSFIEINNTTSKTLGDVVPSNISGTNATYSMRPTAGRVDSQPLQDMLDWLMEDNFDNAGIFTIKKEYWDNLGAISPDGTHPVWLHVVNEILYMHSLDVKLKGELDLDIPEEVEATITSDMPEDEDAPDVSSTEGDDSGDQDVTETPEDESADGEQEVVAVEATDDEDEMLTVTQETNAFSRALAVNEIMKAQGLDDNVGEKSKLLLIDDDRVVSRLTLSRPVAIGVRGLRIEVDPQTGTALRIESWRP